MSLVSGLDNGLVIGILIAGGTLFILAMMSIVIFVAIVCLKQKQVMPSVSNDLQQETLKERESAAPHQIQSEDYEILSELKSNSAYIPSYTQQVLIETKENVAYHCSPIENQHYYSNDQYDYEEIQDF